MSISGHLSRPARQTPSSSLAVSFGIVAVNVRCWPRLCKNSRRPKYPFMHREFDERTFDILGFTILKSEASHLRELTREFLHSLGRFLSFVYRRKTTPSRPSLCSSRARKSGHCSSTPGYGKGRRLPDFLQSKGCGDDRNDFGVVSLSSLVMLTSQQKDVVFPMTYASPTLSVLICMSGRRRRSITC